MTCADDDADDVDEFMPWDDWVKLSDAEQDAILNSEMRQWAETWDRLPRAVQIKHSIRLALKTCADWRRTLKTMDLPVFREHLRERQRRLLELRIERNSGNVVGHA
jgi:hypothetical protein